MDLRLYIWCKTYERAITMMDQPTSRLERLIKPIVMRSVKRIPNIAAIYTLLNEPSANEAVLVTRDASLYSRCLIEQIKQGSNINLRSLALHDEENLKVLSADLSAGYAKFITLHIAPSCGPFRLHDKSFSHKLWYAWIFTKSIFGGRSLVIQIGTPEIPATARVPVQTLERLLRRSFQHSAIMTHGPFFLPRSRQVNAVLNSAYFQAGLQQLAQSSGTSPEALRKLAAKEFIEIAASPRRWVLGFGSFVSELVLNRLYPRRTIRGIDSLRKALQTGAVVLVPPHRSHLDYILISKILYDHGLNPPLVAAGVNLRFWPFGAFIRGVGAFFVKRDAASDRLHSLILRTYVRFLTRRGHLQEFFIEGGRSRSGHLLEPKYGLLGTYVHLVTEGIKKDILFVPVGIAYERLVEEKGFGQENTGAKKAKETFLSLLKTRSFLKQSYGEVALDFGEPVSLRNFITENPTFSEKDITRGIAKNIMHGIAEQCPVTLSSIAASVLYECPNYGTSGRLFEQSFGHTISFLGLMRDLAFPLGKETQTLHDALSRDGNEHGLPHSVHPNQLVSLGALNKAIEHTKLPGGSGLHIPGGLRYSVAFYRNSLSSLFAIPALLSLCEDYFGGINEENLKALSNDIGFLMMLNDNEWLPNFPSLAAKLEASEIWTRDGNQFRYKQKISPYYLAFYYQEFLLSAWLILARLQGLSNPYAGESFPGIMKELQTWAKPLSYLPRLGSSYSFSSSALSHAASFLEKKQAIKVSGNKAGKQISLRESPALSIENIERYLFSQARRSGKAEIIHAWMSAMGRPLTNLNEEKVG
jgi:glycerol-3-phosphate O-acyltransferase